MGARPKAALHFSLKSYGKVLPGRSPASRGVLFHIFSTSSGGSPGEAPGGPGEYFYSFRDPRPVRGSPDIKQVGGLSERLLCTTDQNLATIAILLRYYCTSPKLLRYYCIMRIHENPMQYADLALRPRTIATSPILLHVSYTIAWCFDAGRSWPKTHGVIPPLVGTPLPRTRCIQYTPQARIGVRGVGAN